MRGAGARLVSRAVQGIFVVFAASTLTFALLHLAPGDPFSSMGEGSGWTPTQRALVRQRFSLDKPIGEQYAAWLRNLGRGNFGESSDKQRPVAAVLADAIPNTVLLMSLAYVASIVFGVMLGAWQGAHVGSRRDRAWSSVLLTAYSLPQFWLALMLLLVFAQWLHWFPAGGMTDPFAQYLPLHERIEDRLRHLVLPWASLTLIGTALFARYQREAMRTSMQQAFVQTARANGLSEPIVRRRALRAALTPVITIAGVMLPALLGGALFVEKVYSWPGVGFLLFSAISARDYFVVNAVVVIGSAMTVVGTLLADVVRAWADPREAAL